MEAHRRQVLCRIATKPLLSKRISTSFVRRPHRRSVVLTHTLDIFVNDGCFLFVVRLRSSHYLLFSLSFPTGSGADLGFFPLCDGNVGSLRIVVSFRWQLRQMYPLRRACATGRVPPSVGAVLRKAAAKARSRGCMLSAVNGREENCTRV